uniref:Rubrerythrin diiron-binding domain-containing protein n=1 Tax=viral metagenome TaxID=1070528 RepID=A0A6M3X552_9ZZZZ
MDLRDWRALSSKEQEEHWGKMTAIDQCNLALAGAPLPEGAKCELQTAKCSDNLLSIQNVMKQELRDEGEGASRYREMATKLTAMGEPQYSETIKLLSQAEQMHKMVLEAIVHAIDLRCGQEVSSKHIPADLKIPSMRGK